MITENGVGVIAYTEIRNGICEKCHIKMDKHQCPACGGTKGELVVAFNSAEAGDYWGNKYQQERLKYCMRHRGEQIPEHLRTGGKLPLFKSKKTEANRLKELNQKEEINTGGKQ